MVKQDELKDCGVSCISMIVKYYGGFVKKSTLIDMTKTNREGTTAYHIKNTFNDLGFESKGIECKLSDITKDNIILPCIASVIINKSYKHFIVIYEINFNKKYLVIGDPADKVKKIKYKEFEEIFNNVLIISYPIKTLPIEKNISYTNFIIKLLKPNKKILKNIFILSFFITILSCITSFYTEYMINCISIYSKYYLFFIFCIFFSIYILKILTNYFRNKLLSFINQKLDLVLTLNIFNKIIKLPYIYYQNKTTGDIVSRINDLDNVRDMISKVALSIFVDLPLTFVSLIVLFIINKILFIIGVIILVLYLIIIILFRGFFNNYIKKIQVKKSEVASFMVESISGFETVKGINIEKNIIDKFENKYVKLLKDIFNYQNLFFLQSLFKEIINDIGFILITLIGCLLVIKGEMNLGSLFTFTSLLVYFLEPIKNIINLDNIVKEAKVSLNRIMDLINIDFASDGFLTNYSDGDILFKNLKFSMNDRDYILNGINLKIKTNEKVMVVGKSGSGKSTLFKILSGLYKVKSNMVFINNIDINNYNDDVLKDNIMYLGQDEILFNDTVYNNLVFDNNVSSKLLGVSNICFINEIVDEKLGFNMLIEENGFNLSGGEKQRIILARTLLRKFNILIIDEGLSQVDIDMERKILKNIFKYFKDKTIIFISHRLDNLDLFNKLIRIDNGVVIDGKNRR